jgi:hypothetical protein
MTPACEGPAPARTGSIENTTDRKHLGPERIGQHQEATTAGGLLRQLAQGLLDGPHDEAGRRLIDAATQAADWVARGLVDRTSALCVVAVTAQVIGIPQEQAHGALRRAFGLSEAR